MSEVQRFTARRWRIVAADLIPFGLFVFLLHAAVRLFIGELPLGWLFVPLGAMLGSLFLLKQDQAAASVVVTASGTVVGKAPWGRAIELLVDDIDLPRSTRRGLLSKLTGTQRIWTYSGRSIVLTRYAFDPATISALDERLGLAQPDGVPN